MKEGARVLTLRQAAELLQISPNTLRRYLQTGVIPGRRVGRDWRISEVALHDWLAASEKPPDVLTVPQVAELLESSELAIYHKIRRKEIPAVVIGGRIYVPREQLVLWLENQAGYPMNTLRKVLGLHPREVEQ
jgi:excisionase family DNA binding protein